MEPEAATERSTATLDAARADARAQAGAAAQTAVTIPSSAAIDLPDGVRSGDVLWDETIGAGEYAARVLPRHAELRVIDIHGDGCIQLLVYNARRTQERLNVIDTVKVQWQAYLGPGALLLSDMGRVLMTIVDDTSARHDVLGGCSNRRSNAAKYGDGGIHGPHANARDLLALAAAKHGMDRRDVNPPANLFKGVIVAHDGSLSFAGEPRPGAAVTLRAEMGVIVLVANTPHPLDPRAEYLSTPVRFTAYRKAPADPDPFRATTPERERAFLNTDEYLLGVHG